MNIKRTLTAAAVSAIFMSSIAYANTTLGTNQVSSQVSHIESARLGSAKVDTGSARLPLHTKLRYTIEGDVQTVNANLFKSSQGYYMYTIAGYRASAEEPGVDVILSGRNKTDYMRIEKLPQHVSLSRLKANTKTLLRTLGKVQVLSSHNSFFKHASFEMHSQNRAVSETAIVLKINGFYYRFVIHVRSDTESISQYFAMIQSVHTMATTTTGTGIAAGSLAVSLVDAGSTSSGEHTFTLQIKNQTETEQDLYFANGEQFDYILSKDGQVIKQYSRGIMFAMHTETVALKQGDAFTVPITIDGLAPGHYELTAWVTCSPSTDKVSVSFDV